MVRYSVLFQTQPEFFQSVIQRFFSDKAILSKQKAVASIATYEFMKLAEKFRKQPAFNSNWD